MSLINLILPWSSDPYSLSLNICENPQILRHWKGEGHHLGLWPGSLTTVVALNILLPGQNTAAYDN